MSRNIRRTRGYILAALVLAAAFLCSNPAVAGSRNAGAPAGAAVGSWAGEEASFGALWLEGYRWLMDLWSSWAKEGSAINPDGHKALAVAAPERIYSRSAAGRGVWAKEGSAINPDGSPRVADSTRPSGPP